MELLRRLASEAPELRSFHEDKPTLLVSWWCTIYAVTIICFRVCGRYVRTERIFTEDGIMLVAVIPLLIRMGLVHVVLLFGTNNAVITELSLENIQRREIGSKLVLVSRIMYAAYLWTVKYSTFMFVRSLAEPFWQSSHKILMRCLHAFLALTFFAIVISDLAACQPFSHYWQVTPDPGTQCRSGYPYLFTMASLNIITNLTLFLFPLPAIMISRLSKKQKASIIFRLALPLLSTALNAYQIFRIIDALGAQPIRSLLASFDILLSTGTANAVVLASLLQDRGYKKSKFKQRSIDRKSSIIEGRKNRWGSDEDLIVDGDRKELIRMEVLKGERPFSEVSGVSEPGRAKLQEIRVASTWEVHVDRRSAMKDNFL